MGAEAVAVASIRIPTAVPAQPQRAREPLRKQPWRGRENRTAAQIGLQMGRSQRPLPRKSQSQPARQAGRVVGGGALAAAARGCGPGLSGSRSSSMEVVERRWGLE